MRNYNKPKLHVRNFFGEWVIVNLFGLMSTCSLILKLTTLLLPTLFFFIFLRNSVVPKYFPIMYTLKYIFIPIYMYNKTFKLNQIF